jgi:sensor histidine kinase YesM
MKMDAGENKGVSGGIGLQNVERRLELLYCGKYSLQRQIRDGRHEVELEILKE